MSAFKDALKNDLKTVFFNVGEFAEMCNIDYDGVEYSAPVVIDKNILQDRKQSASDHEAELARREVMVYIMTESLPVTPQKNHYISINGQEFVIIDNSEDNCLHELVCEVFEE